MHAISDGERRRVQLTMGLMQPWDLLLLDEVCMFIFRSVLANGLISLVQVTVNLDVLVRSNLLNFLSHGSFVVLSLPKPIL